MPFFWRRRLAILAWTCASTLRPIYVEISFVGIQPKALNGPNMTAMLWTIVVILVVLWALGLFTHVAGGLIHLLLVIAVILFVVNLIRGRRIG
jgi:Family of unknown function (DUF5670)